MLYASPNHPCVSSLGSHTNPASWQGPGLKCPFHRSKNKEPLDTSRLETNSQMQLGGFTLKRQNGVSSPTKLRQSRKLGSTNLCCTHLGLRWLYLNNQKTSHTLEVTYWRTVPRRGPVNRRRLPGELKRKGFGGQSLFEGMLSGGSKSYPWAKTAGEPSVWKKPPARFITRLSAFAGGLAADGRRFIAEGTEGNQLALV